MQEDKNFQDSTGKKGVDKSVNLAAEIKSRYRKCSNHYADWNKVSEEDYNFALGKQWTAEELEILKKQKRPANTFNRIKPYINLVGGHQRENSSRIKVTPEGGEDEVFSEVMDRALVAIDKWSKLDYKLSYTFDDGSICGKGFIEAVLDYQKDPIRGEIKWINLKPGQILVDPECNEYDINEGAEYAFKVVKYTRQKLKAMFPGKAAFLDKIGFDDDDLYDEPSTEGDKDNYGNSPNRTSVINETSYQDQGDELKIDNEFTYREYWFKKYVSKYFVLDRNADEESFKKFATREEAEAFVAEQGGGTVIERLMPEMWFAPYVCGKVLDEAKKSPFEPNYSGFPFFRYLAEWTPSAPLEEYKVQGITRQLKDPQREKNKSRSQFLHIINTQANSGFIGEEDALSPEGWKEVKSGGSQAGLTIRLNQGYYEKFREIQPKAPQMGQIMREQSADEEFKQISGINPDLLGMQEKTASGRAIALRMRQAVMALVRMFSNFRYTKEIIGKFLLQMLPELFDATKLARVIGPSYMRSITSDAMPEGLTTGILKGYLQIVKDHKYDVMVTEADHNRTIRYEIFEQLAKLAESYGPMIPLQLIVEYMDVQNKDEIIKKIETNQQMMAEKKEK